MLDDLDRQIIGVLHLLPRASWDEVASVVSVDASTVSRRYSRLVADNVLRVVGELSWTTYSTTYPVHLRIQTHSASPARILDDLAALPQTIHVASTYGLYPLFATIHAASEQETGEVLQAVYGMDGVSSIMTLPILTFGSKGSRWDPQLLTDPQREACRVLAVAAGELGAEDSAQAIPPSGMDPVEKRALSLLQREGRLSASRLARELGIANSTAQRMIRRFMDHQWFTPRVEIDGAYLGFEAPFVLSVKTSLDSAGEVVRRLTEHPALRFVSQVASEYNMFCTGMARDREHLAQLINEDFGALPGVRDVSVDLFLTEAKRFWMSRGSGQRLNEFVPPPLV